RHPPWHHCAGGGVPGSARIEGGYRRSGDHAALCDFCGNRPSRALPDRKRRLPYLKIESDCVVKLVGLEPTSRLLRNAVRPSPPCRTLGKSTECVSTETGIEPR